MSAAISSIGESKWSGIAIGFERFWLAFGPVILDIAVLTCRLERPAMVVLTTKKSTLSQFAHFVLNASCREMP